jgi:predicted nuclease with TOPRIM domain
MKKIKAEINELQNQIKRLQEQEAELQRKLEAQKGSFEGKVEELISNCGLPRTIMGRDITTNKFSDNTGHVIVPLPSGNAKWTIEAYEWAISFTRRARAKGNHVYVDHDENKNCNDHYSIYIYAHMSGF